MSGESTVKSGRRLHDADVVYLYDGSFEGFLCCVFESFAQHEIPFAVWTPQRETSTLYPVKDIATDHATARRVFASFGSKLGAETEYLVSRDFLSGREDKELLLIRFLHLAFALGPGTVKREGHQGINSFGIHISDKVTEIRTLKNVKAENKKLKAEVEELTTQLTTTKLEQYELDNYRQLLDLDAKYPSYPKVAASVIAKDSGNWFSTFTIDKGKKDGVDVGMNVLAGSGLVGIVTDAGDNFAKVRCIIDDASKVSGMVSTTEDNLTVSGNIKTMNDDKVITFTELKDDDNKVKEGDPVVTSYVSDRYQQGILIGYVTKIENNSNNLTKSGTITPVVDFEHIENVMVITQLKQTGDTKTADDTESTETAGDSQTENSTENK